jgi:hypothetical protein
MTINKKLARNIIIGIVFLAILGGSYLWALNWQPEDKKTNQPTSDTISLFSEDTENISKIIIKNNDGVLTISRADDKNWTIAEKPDYTFSQTKLQNAVLNISNIMANRKISDNAENLSDFGFGSDSCSLTVLSDDGKSTSFILGDRLAVNSEYYIKNSAENSVYTISDSIASLFFSGANDFRMTTLAKIDNQSITKITISKAGSLLMNVEKVALKSGNTHRSTEYIMTYPYKIGVDPDNFPSLIEAFSSVNVLNFADDSILNKSKYGFDDGFKVTVSDSSATHTLSFGATDENGNVYAICDDNPFIFTMDPQLNNKLKDINPINYAEKYVHIYNIDDVSSVCLEYNGKKHIMAIEGDEKSAKYSINKEGSTEKAFKSAYQKIIGVSFAQIASQAKPGKPLLSITFTLKNGDSESYSYFEHNDRYVLSQSPDGTRFLVLKKLLTELTDAVDSLENEPSKIVK